MRTIKGLRRRIGIFAPQVIVRSRLPWQLRLPGVALVTLVVAAAILGVFEMGRRSAEFGAADLEGRLGALIGATNQLETQNAELRARLTDRERQIQVEQETQISLAQQVKALQADNIHLKEDLALFESLLSRRGTPEPLSLLQFKVERGGGAAGEYRYRFLLAQNGGAKRFQGRYELRVRGRQAQKAVVLRLPPDAPPDNGAYRLNFQHFQRVEGNLRVPADLDVSEVEVQVFESGAAEAKLLQVARPA